MVVGSMCRHSTRNRRFAYWFWPAAGYAIASQIFGWLLVLTGIVQICVSAGINRPRGWGWWLAGGVIDLFVGILIGAQHHSVGVRISVLPGVHIHILGNQCADQRYQSATTQVLVAISYQWRAASAHRIFLYRGRLSSGYDDGKFPCSSVIYLLGFRGGNDSLRHASYRLRKA